MHPIYFLFFQLSRPPSLTWVPTLTSQEHLAAYCLPPSQHKVKGPFPSDIHGADLVTLRLEVLIAFLCPEDEAPNLHTPILKAHILSGPTCSTLGPTGLCPVSPFHPRPLSFKCFAPRASPLQIMGSAPLHPSHLRLVVTSVRRLSLKPPR